VYILGLLSFGKTGKNEENRSGRVRLEEGKTIFLAGIPALKSGKTFLKVKDGPEDITISNVKVTRSNFWCRHFSDHFLLHIF